MRRGALLSSLALLAGLTVWAWLSRKSALAPPAERVASFPEDPRLAPDVPSRNVRPEVRYVGDDACARCHADLSRSFHQHPMGRSVAAVQEATPLERFDTEAGNPFDDSLFRYRVERRNGH
jgi:hypothetical protein